MNNRALLTFANDGPAKAQLEVGLANYNPYIGLRGTVSEGIQAGAYNLNVQTAGGIRAGINTSSPIWTMIATMDPGVYLSWH